MRNPAILTIGAVAAVTLGVLLAILMDPVRCLPASCPEGTTCDQVCEALLWPHLVAIAVGAVVAWGLLIARRRLPTKNARIT